MPRHVRDEAEVLFVHEGALSVGWPAGTREMGVGDTLSVPSGVPRELGAGDQGAVVYVVRGGDAPAAPRPA